MSTTADKSWKPHNRHDAQPVVGHVRVDVLFLSELEAFNAPAYAIAWDIVKAWRHADTPPEPAAPAAVPPQLIDRIYATAVSYRDSPILGGILLEAATELRIANERHENLKRMWVQAAANEEHYYKALQNVIAATSGVHRRAN